MTTQNTQKENIKTQQMPDQTGSLANSARRHLAYEALSQQIALSEAALQRVLEAIARCQTTGNGARQETSGQETSGRVGEA